MRAAEPGVWDGGTVTLDCDLGRHFASLKSRFLIGRTGGKNGITPQLSQAAAGMVQTSGTR